MADLSFRQILKTIVMSVAVIAILLKLFFIDRYRIPQNGMYPGLPAGSRLLALKAQRAYGDASNVKRGDIVAFVRNQNGKPYNYIWRVVGLPGETIEISGQSLLINGKAVERQQVREADGKTIFLEKFGEASYEVAFLKSPSDSKDVSVTIPADQFFVMGDNRNEAYDSRSFGPISFDSIIAKKL